MYTKGISNIVEISPNSFMSTIELCEKSNNLITEHSSDWVDYLRKSKIDLEFVSDVFDKIKPKGDQRELINHVYKSYKPELVIIDKGLMAGFYFYSKDLRKAYYYFENPNKIEFSPLKKYSLIDNIPEFDLIISYSKKDIAFTRDMFQMLSFNFKIFFLDIEKVKEDPLWHIRYREAMYHSHYFIPIFSENYLTTQGALSEFFECIYLNIDFRLITFYNYFIPFILGDLSFDKIKTLIEKNKVYGQHYNYDAELFFEILNDINFGLKLENTSFKEIVMFFKSLLFNDKENIKSRNQTASIDYEFLKILLKQADFIICSNLSESEFSGEYLPALKVVSLFIKKSTNKWNLIDVLSDGRCINRQFTTEIQSNAKKVNKNSFEEILSFLEGGE